LRSSQTQIDIPFIGQNRCPADAGNCIYIEQRDFLVFSELAISANREHINPPHYSDPGKKIILFGTLSYINNKKGRLKKTTKEVEQMKKKKGKNNKTRHKDSQIIIGLVVLSLPTSSML